MQTQYSDGFTRSRLLLVVGGILLLIVSMFLVYWGMSSDQEKTVTDFGNQFVTNINQQQADQGYAKLDDSLKKELGSIYSWTIWLGEFKRWDYTVEDTPSNVDRVGFNVSNPQFVLRYNVSNGVKLDVTVNKEKGDWRIHNYEIVE